MIKTMLIRTMLMVGLLCSGLLLSGTRAQEEGHQIRREARTTQRREDSGHRRNSRWTHSVDGHEKSVTVRDEVGFNDDYTDVTNVSANGAITNRLGTWTIGKPIDVLKVASAGSSGMCGL